jgi:hypothetical protein
LESALHYPSVLNPPEFAATQPNHQKITVNLSNNTESGFMQVNHFQHFAPVIRSLTSAELDGSSSLNAKLRIAQDGLLEVCYAPFEYINPKARIVIVGITPGRTQMLNALRELRRQLDAGVCEAAALRAAKLTGAFSGAMRPNLVALMDAIGLHGWLGIKSCADLFGISSELVQTASVLRNPVFLKGDNYNGTPSMIRHKLLQAQLVEGFGQDVKELPRAVYVPLGDKVTEALYFLADRGLLNRQQILDGLPHPSGANTERIAYFLGNKERSALSVKTNAAKLDQLKSAILEKVGRLA